MKTTSRTREKRNIKLLSCNASPFRAATNGSVITLATRVRNENVGGAMVGRHCEQNDVAVTREQMDDTKCAM